MRTRAKLAASVVAIAASVLAVGCAGHQDASRVNEPTSAPTTETTRYGTESYSSPLTPAMPATPTNKGIGDENANGGYYGSERGAKSPGGDINPQGGKSPGGDVGQTPASSPDVSPRSATCSAIPPGGGHGSSGIKPGPMSGSDARTTDCPDWQESEQGVPGGRGTIQ
jgi:hypothetical protein